MEEPRRSWLTRNVLVLGLVSLLTDAASEMIIPLLPLFLTGTLGASAVALGLIEGLADFVAAVLKLLSGRWADRLGKNRPFVLAGYGLASTVRPFVALAVAPWHVLAVRVLDRTGKGLRTSPRDALIAASVEPDQRGAAFGLHRAMDHVGAVIGPLVAAAYLVGTSGDLRTLFWLSAIPGAAAVLLVATAVREEGREGASDAALEDEASAGPADPPEPVRPPGELRRFLLPLGLFTLGNASDVFLLLKAGAERAPIVTLPLLWVGLHVVKAVASVPGGKLADRWGRRRTIAVGWLLYAAIYLGFAAADTPAAVAALFVVYGVYHGLTEGPEKALVAELAPRGRTGTAFGWYHLVLGVLSLTASVLFGGLWTTFGDGVAFTTSAGLALVAVGALATLAPPAE